jgi:His-Xaa-Ser system radical SAM maturase HxsB
MMATGLKALTGRGLSLANPFRFGRVGGKVLLTNDAGEFVFLGEEDFTRFVAGKLARDSAAWADLEAKHFIRSPESEAALAELFAKKNAFLFNGPYLHIVIVTLRCNEVCIYCHASRKDMAQTSYDMTPELAGKVVDTIFQSPSETITIEFQGGEPLVAWDTVKTIIDLAVAKNRTAGKRLEFSLVTNMALMTDDKLELLMKNNVQICTSIDGPRHVHDANRKLLGGSAYEQAVYWMARADQAYRAKGLDPDLYHVEALLTVTRETLRYPKEVVDEYVRLGRKAIFLRPLNPFGFAKQTFERIGYTSEEFMDFYFKAVNYMLELNRKGVEILERTAAILLTKMLTPYDPNYLDLRSPCGAGIGQIAYNHDGTVFTCDEGRMLYQMGDDMFQIGKLPGSSYRDLVESAPVKALAVASCTDLVPGCSDSVFKPYLGVCPVYNYSEQGGIFGNMNSSQRHKWYVAMLEYLFGLLVTGEQETLDILKKWTIVRDRSVFFMHE